MPSTGPTPPADIADLPPAYTPRELPDYTYTDPHDQVHQRPQENLQDRSNYALAMMMHNLRVNGGSESLYTHMSLSSSLSGTRVPLPTPPGSRSPSPRVSTVNPPIVTPGSYTRDRCLRAAKREFQASQNPELWGRRVVHGWRARLLPEEEEEGFWGWLGDLFVIRDERGNPIPLGATSPWGIIGPGGAF